MVRPEDHPRVFVVKTSEVALTGVALLELMRAVLARGLPFRFRARGWSMSPFIHDGDVLTVVPLVSSKHPSELPGVGVGVTPRVGDVVAFVHPGSGSLVLHRVVRIRASGVLIRGDALENDSDGIVPLENILGRVTNIDRNGRAVRLSLGPERRAVAWLSQRGMLLPLRARVTGWMRPFRGGRSPAKRERL